MGNVGNVMHSLRSRFSPSKGKASPISSSSNVSSYASPATTLDRDGSSSALCTSPSSIFDACRYTPPTTPSKTRRAVHKTVFLVDVPCGVKEVEEKEEDDTRWSHVSAHAELAASRAMLEFARRLPLEELSTIGNCLGPPSTSCTNATTAAEDVSDYESAQRQAQITTSKHKPPTQASSSSASLTSLPWRHPGSGEVDRAEELHSSVTVIRHSSSQTLSLSSTSSASTWSFACRSARCIEREHEASGSDEDEAASSGSLSGWGVGDSGKPSSSPVRQYKQAFSISDAEFDEPFVRDADVWSVTSIASADAAKVEDEMREPEGHPAFMCDDEFDAMPDWSDVEDDPEYNGFFEHDTDVWSTTSRASEDMLVMPDVYVPTEHAGFTITQLHKASTAELDGVVLPTFFEEKKRKQEGDEEKYVPSKRQKLHEEKVQEMAESIMDLML